jgi:hypothetical protein
MDVHFISTLTPEDEDRFAPVVIDALKAILDVMPISYTVRIETANARVFQHSNTGRLDDKPGETNGRLVGGHARRPLSHEPTRA